MESYSTESLDNPKYHEIGDGEAMDDGPTENASPTDLVHPTKRPSGSVSSQPAVTSNHEASPNTDAMPADPYYEIGDDVRDQVELPVSASDADADAKSKPLTASLSHSQNMDGDKTNVSPTNSTPSCVHVYASAMIGEGDENVSVSPSNDHPFVVKTPLRSVTDEDRVERLKKEWSSFRSSNCAERSSMLSSLPVLLQIPSSTLAEETGRETQKRNQRTPQKPTGRPPAPRQPRGRSAGKTGRDTSRGKGQKESPRQTRGGARRLKREVPNEADGDEFVTMPRQHADGTQCVGMRRMRLNSNSTSPSPSPHSPPSQPRQPPQQQVMLPLLMSSHKSHASTACGASRGRPNDADSLLRQCSPASHGSSHLWQMSSIRCSNTSTEPPSAEYHEALQRCIRRIDERRHHSGASLNGERATKKRSPPRPMWRAKEAPPTSTVEVMDPHSKRAAAERERLRNEELDRIYGGGNVAAPHVGGATNETEVSAVVGPGDTAPEAAKGKKKKKKRVTDEGQGTKKISAVSADSIVAASSVMAAHEKQKEEIEKHEEEIEKQEEEEKEEIEKQEEEYVEEKEEEEYVEEKKEEKKEEEYVEEKKEEEYVEEKKEEEYVEEKEEEEAAGEVKVNAVSPEEVEGMEYATPSMMSPELDMAPAPTVACDEL